MRRASERAHHRGTPRPSVRDGVTGEDGRASRHEWGLRCVAEAGRLLARARGPEDGLRDVARLLVPALADRARIAYTTGGGESRVVAEPDGGDGAHHGHALRVPLVAGGDQYGTLALERARDSRPFDDEDRALAEAIADPVALAVAAMSLADRAREAESSRAQFLATVSHELRTPLQVVIGYVELLEAGIPVEVPEAARAQVEHIGRAAAHLHSIVDQILGFARIDAGRERVRLERVDVGALARQAAQLIEPLARRKGLAMALNVPEDGGLATETDAVKVRQILYNLLSNAVKFTDQGGVELRVARDASANVVRFTVTDTGVGMTGMQFARAFELFWQAERFAGTGIAPRGGTGLGLTISGELARLLGGEVAGRPAPGGGCEFTLTIPASSGTTDQPGDACR